MGIRYWVLGTGYQVLATRYWVPGKPEADLREAGGRLIGVGLGEPPSKKVSPYFVLSVSTMPGDWLMVSETPFSTMWLEFSKGVLNISM